MNSSRFPVWVVCAVAILAGFIYWGFEPPDVKDSLQNDLASWEQIQKHLEFLSQAPRPVGSDHHQTSKLYIIEQLKALGLQVEVQEKVKSIEWAGEFRVVQLYNILARFPESETQVLWTSHYDSVPHSPGVSDDGLAVAMMLNLARLTAQNPQWQKRFAFLITDGEELGLVGAQQFVQDNQLKNPIVLNFEARGSKGPSALFQMSKNFGDAVQALAKNDSYLVGSSLAWELFRFLPNDTDLTIFMQQGWRGLNFAYADGVHNYHSGQDDRVHLDPRTAAHHWSHALALAHTFGRAESQQMQGHDRVFFSLGRSVLIHYSTRLAQGFGILLSLLLVGLLISRKVQWSWPNWRASGILFFIISAIGVVLALKSLGFVFDRSFLSESRPIVWWFLVLILLLAAMAWSSLAKNTTLKTYSACELILWTLAAISTGFWAPGLSYLFQATAFVMILSVLFSSVWVRVLLQFCLALIWLSTLYSVSIFEGGGLGPFGFVLTSMWLWSLRAVWMAQVRSWQKPLLAAVCLLVVLSVILGVRYLDWHWPKKVWVVHATDVHRHHSYWVFDQRTLNLMKPEDKAKVNRQHFEQFFPWADTLFYLRDDFKPIEAPSLTVVSQNDMNGMRVLNLELRSLREARCMRLWWNKDLGVEEIRVNEDIPHALIRFSREVDKKLFGLFVETPVTALVNISTCAVKTPVKISFRMHSRDAFQAYLVDTKEDQLAEFTSRLNVEQLTPALGSHVNMVGGVYEIPLIK